eukprot:6717274-Lingulodinium_polyedra.AAC.1
MGEELRQHREEVRPVAGILDGAEDAHDLSVPADGLHARARARVSTSEKRTPAGTVCDCETSRVPGSSMVTSATA